MILKVTEFCAWENESWSYVFDMNKQEATCLNYLMIFIRLANKEFERIKEEEDRKPPPISYHPLFNPHPIRVFGASRYNFQFYDGVEQKGESVKLLSTSGNLIMSNRIGYNNSTNLLLDRKISVARMKSAMVSIRGKKKENKLYKRFDSIFLFKKISSAI